MSVTNSEKKKLHSLIHNLTKSEKRYFKIYCNKISPDKEKNYLRLFDLVESMQEMDDDFLIEELRKNEINTTYIDSDKNYLYNLILKTLRVFHSGKSSKLQILEQIEYTEILYTKGLYQQALKQLKKAKKIAHDYDILSLYPEILRLERKIKGQPIKLKSIESEYQEYELAIKKLTNFNEFDFLYRRGNWIRKNEGKVRNKQQLSKFDKILDHQLFSFEGPHSFYASVRYYQTKAAYYYSKDDLKNEFKVNNTLLELFDQHPKIKEENYLEYISIYSRILILIKKINPNDYQKTLLHFKKLGDDAKVDQYSVKSMVSSIFYSTELVRMINQGDFEDGNNLIAEVEETISTYADLISDGFKINFYYKFAYIKIGLGEYSKALDYVNTILNDFNEKNRPDIYSFTKILSTIIHFELGNTNILPYVTQSAYNHLRNRDKLFVVESILLNFIKKFNKVSTPTQWKKNLQQLREKLILACKEPSEKKVLQYFDFISWLDSKLENITFTEAKKRNLEEKEFFNS